MAPTIRIDDEVFQILQKEAIPLVDTPNDVLRRKYGLDEVQRYARPPGFGDVRDTIQQILRRTIESDRDFSLVYESKRWIHFTSRSWDSPHLLKGTRFSGAILTFLFESNSNPKTLRLHLQIQPGDQATRTRIHEAVQGRAPFSGRANLGPVWHMLFRKDFLNSQDYAAHGHDIRWLENRIREKWEEFKATDFPKMDEVIRNIDFGDGARR